MNGQRKTQGQPKNSSHSKVADSQGSGHFVRRESAAVKKKEIAVFVSGFYKKHEKVMSKLAHE